MVQVSYPGVYVQEVPSGVRTITAVGTSTTLFLGRTERGVLNRPLRCTGYADFARAFGESPAVGDMARYLRLFFQNGGSDCYVMRLANGATAASVDLQDLNHTPRIRLTAKQVGLLGEDIRVAVSYAGRRPEVGFNLQIFRWERDPSGRRTMRDLEEWKGLSMDSSSPLYAVDLITQESRLVQATDLTDWTSQDPGDGYVISGRPVAYDAGEDATALANRVAAWQALAGRFQLSTDGSRYVTVALDSIDFAAIDVDPASYGDDLAVGNAAVVAALQTEIESCINTAAGIPLDEIEVTIEDGPAPPAADDETTSDLLRISLSGRNCFIRPAGSNDMAVPLMLGSEQGGLEVGAFASFRPVPTAICIDPSGNDGAVFTTLMGTAQNAVTELTLPTQAADGTLVGAPPALSVDLITGADADPWYRDTDGGNAGLEEKLALIRDAINDEHAAHPQAFFWRAELWGHSRLAILPSARDDNYVDAGTFATATTNLATTTGAVTSSTRYYSLGSGGVAGFQSPGDSGRDGAGPVDTDYDAAYEIVDREVDLFNLMVLPPDADNPGLVRQLWPNASVFCEQRRAFLLLDAPSAWADAQAATDDIGATRIGLVKDYSAIYFPRLRIREGGREIPVGPSGAIAGLMARIDGARGVWKAPAGTEADLRGIVGVDQVFSDRENGILNPRAINTIRVFPNGIVSWGARTMDGDDDFASEWKYIPVRRLALMIEESLYRGLKWVVFEPNDEPLWAQIRLNVGAFMHNLFRQGAFQGARPKDAYFVRCDAETTTQNDIDLGIVNIWVGFAPLKPAEFVVLYLQQIAGQLEV